MPAMDITSTWEGGYRCRVRVRDFEIVSDQPAEYAGTDTGPTPTELFLASLAVCFTMAVHHAFRKRGVDLPDLAVHVGAEYEGLRFGRIRVEVRSSHPKEEIEALMDRIIGYCYVSNTLRNPPDMEFVVADSPLTHRPAPPA